MPDSWRETLSQSKLYCKNQSPALDEDDVRHVAVVQEHSLRVLINEKTVLRVLTNKRPVFRILTNKRTSIIYLVGGGGAVHHLTAPLLLGLTPGQLHADLSEPGREHALANEENV